MVINWYFQDYNCHPETCCHWEHFRYYAYPKGKTSLDSVLDFDTMEELDDYLAARGHTKGELRDPYQRDWEPNF